MKRKILVTLLTMTLTASMICGCGNKPNPDNAAGTDLSTVEEFSESTEEAEPTSVPQATAEPEKVPEATSMPEPTETPETVSEVPETEQETEESKDNDSTDPSGAVDTSVPAEPTAAPETGSSDAATNPEQTTYTVTEMSATMYAVNAVNLRHGPGTEYAKVGNLTKGQQVAVTGQAGNGWYQLDNGAFVSNKYLSDTAPVQQTVATVPADTLAVPVDTTGVVAVPGTNINVSSGTDFVNYLNQQRSAAGLGTLTWDDGMASVAQRRAQEISTDLSHNGNVEKYGEIIQLAVTGSASDWYTSWYNSEAHRTSMLAVNYTRAGCAVYAIGNNYYVVCNFAGTPASTEHLIEQAQPDNLIHAGGNESGTTDSFSTTGETLDPNNPDDAEIWNAIKDTQDQLNNGEIDRVYD